MEKHRLVPHCGLRIEHFDAPFSSFECVNSLYAGNPAVHRCMSLARSFSAQTMVVEEIAAAGHIADENDELAQAGYAFHGQQNIRLSFWTTPGIDEPSIKTLRDEDLIGFAILKYDHLSKTGEPDYNRWHIFDAVFTKYKHEHNCIPNLGSYRVRVGDRTYTIQGVLYCQQNGLTKVCAHVALRSLLSRSPAGGKASYAQMNQIARGCAGSYKLGDGLDVHHIRAILDSYGIKYKDVDYRAAARINRKVRYTHPYQKYLYAGIESGYGGLLGFKLEGPKTNGGKHIIPFFGHTFNKDTWVPDAQVAYFNIGKKMKYMPSEIWTSSFIGHDDNFGPNFCVPRLYVRAENVQYVVEIRKPGVEDSGVYAEALASRLLYSLCRHKHRELDGGSPWQKRLAECAASGEQRLVLRTLVATRAQYLSHLLSVKDWEGQSEDPKILGTIRKSAPTLLWIVEVSMPQLFPANERKLGEIVLDASCPITAASVANFSLFVLARLPGQYIVMSGLVNGSPQFITVPSGLASHVDLMKQ